MTLTRTNAFGSDGHLRSPQRSEQDAFFAVKRKDEAKWGTYRAKDTILEIYAALAAATQSGQPYQTRFTPAPADSTCCHPPKPNPK